MNVFEASLALPADKASVIARSLLPESKGESRERSKTTVTHEGNLLKLRIDAPDLHALRAAINTYLKWVIMCDRLME